MLGAVLAAAGCGSNNNNSGYGVAWVTLTDSPGDFTSYIVNVDYVELTRTDGYVATALDTAETVDFTKLGNVAELWGTATVPTGTYVSASIELDYTSAQIYVMVNGLPQKATVVDSAGNAVTTQIINVILDPAHQLTLQPTYATTAAQRLALDINLAASTSSINLSTNPVTVTVKPYLTAAIAGPDNKLIRVRGPLINSSVDLDTYTVYVRPFFDEADDLGSLTLFGTANTTYTINGVVSTGITGLTQLSQSSASSTITAAYTEYTPTATPSASAGTYTVKYVVAGSSLEDIYTQGLEGDVVARTGNTLTVRGATLQIDDGSNTGNTIYNSADVTLLVGPSTTVTADNDTSLTNLNYLSIGVGQHIIARGLCSFSNNGCSSQVPPAAGLTFDARANSTNTGSVRLIATNLWGSLVSSATGNLLLNVQTINNWPITDFTFAGNGTSAAADPTGANFLVNTGAIVLPDTTAGDNLWIDGTVAPFGSAPPDFNATTVNDELSVQMVAAATPSAGATCGQGTQDCLPASMRVFWSGAGTSTPFAGLSSAGMSIDLSNASFSSGTIRIGAESIDMTTLPSSPTIMATVAAMDTTATATTSTGATASGATPQSLPPVTLPDYSYGNPAAAAPAGIYVYSDFATFATNVTTALASTPAVQFEARGTYDRASNTFYAISVNVVL